MKPAFFELVESSCYAASASSMYWIISSLCSPICFIRANIILRHSSGALHPDSAVTLVISMKLSNTSCAKPSSTLSPNYADMASCISSASTEIKYWLFMENPCVRFDTIYSLTLLHLTSTHHLYTREYQTRYEVPYTVESEEFNVCL